MNFIKARHTGLVIRVPNKIYLTLVGALVGIAYVEPFEV
jgi:hypothetical protein